MEYGKDDVLKFLPHRDPFLFIDSIEYVSLPSFTFDNSANFKQLIGAKVKGHFYVRPDLEILKGHFPGNPLVPGVVQIEMMAQTSCFAVLKYLALFKNNRENQLTLVTVERAKFRKPVYPNTKLEIYSTLTSARANFSYYDCIIKSDDQLISEASIMASIGK
ncbi:MAG: 3-hydroxyacyl-ACP dehydratase FabZ family protein [Bacteriovoracaceae bacterium]